MVIYLVGAHIDYEAADARVAVQIEGRGFSLDHPELVSPRINARGVAHQAEVAGSRALEEGIGRDRAGIGDKRAGVVRVVANDVVVIQCIAPCGIAFGGKSGLSVVLYNAVAQGHVHRAPGDHWGTPNH